MPLPFVGPLARNRAHALGRTASPRLARWICSYTCVRSSVKRGSARVVIWSRSGAQVDRQVLLHPRRRLRQHDDAFAQVHRLIDVVRHEEDRHPALQVQAAHEVFEVGAGLGVDRGERLVHDEHLGLVRDRARDRDALLHPAGELPRVALGGVVEPDRREGVVDEAVALGAAEASCA